MSTLGVVIVIVITLLLSALFSGSEMAYVAANRLRVEMRARDRGRLGLVTQSFIQNPARLLTTTLVGNNLALVVYSAAAAFLLQPPLQAFFGDFVGLGNAGTQFAVLAGQTIIASIVVLFVGEIVPKSIMRDTANRAVFALAMPLQLTRYLLLPFILLANRVSSLLLKMFGMSAESFPRLLRRDFELLIERGMRRGTLELDEDEQALISNVFAMDSMRVRESMVPRTEVQAIDDTTSIEALREKFVETGFSKIPVYHENIDNVIGMAFAHDLFQRPESLKDILRPVKFVPESRSSKELLREFLNSNLSIAIVLDEYGGVAGIVTLEDLLEELFGDIQDEFDAKSDVVRQLNENTFLVSGRVELDDLKENFGIELPDGAYETVAGYILEHRGTIPMPREEFRVGDLTFHVLRSTANRIDLVRMTVHAPPVPASKPSEPA